MRGAALGIMCGLLLVGCRPSQAPTLSAAGHPPSPAAPATLLPGPTGHPLNPAALTSDAPLPRAEPLTLGPAMLLAARDGGLWRLDKPAQQLSALPAAGPVTRLEVSTRVVAIQQARAWHAFHLARGQWQALPCAGDILRLNLQGTHVACADAQGVTLVVELASNRVWQRPDIALPHAFLADVAAEQVAIIWSDEQAVWQAALTAQPLSANKRQLAKLAPRAHFLPNPQGTRALGYYQGIVRRAGKAETLDMLHGFALDGIGARRKAIQRGVPLAWASDGKWALVQDGPAACVMRGVGGEYKCWKGYQGVAIAPDGKHALLLGPPRGEGKPSKSEKPNEVANEGSAEEDASTDGSTEGDESATPPPPVELGPHPVLYKAKLAGAFTEGPAVIEANFHGRAAWVPAVNANEGN